MRLTAAPSFRCTVAGHAADGFDPTSFDGDAAGRRDRRRTIVFWAWQRAAAGLRDGRGAADNTGEGRRGLYAGPFVRTPAPRDGGRAARGWRSLRPTPYQLSLLSLLLLKCGA